MPSSSETTQPDFIEFLQQGQLNRDRLYNALPGYFSRYYQLLESEKISDIGERLVIEEQLGIICEAFGPEKMAGELFMQGYIKTRADVYKLVVPIIERKDLGNEESLDYVTLIGIVGRISSGKGSVGEIISNQFGSIHLPLSDRLREIAGSNGQLPPFSRESLRSINDEYKPRFGNEVFVRWTLSTAKNLANRYNKKIMSMDGFRSLDEAKYFKEQRGILIAVEADDDIRYQRLLERNRGADDFSYEAFKKSDEIERAWIDPIFEIADMTVINNGTYDELQQSVLNSFSPLFD